MVLTKKVMSNRPIPGWTPVANTVYLCTLLGGILYAPLPDTASGIGYVYLHDSILFTQLLQADKITLGIIDEATTANDIHLHYIRDLSPYVLVVTVYGQPPIHLTVRSSKDTVTYIANNAQSVEANTLCLNRFNYLDSLQPSYCWTFSEMFILDGLPTWVDTKQLAQLTCMGASVAYPSSLSDASSYGLLTGSADITSIPLIIPDPTVFSALAVYGGEDGLIISLGGISLYRTNEQLTLHIGTNIHTTIQWMECIAGTTLPGYEVGFVYDNGYVTLLYEGTSLGTFPVALGTIIGEEHVLRLGGSNKQYSLIMVYTNPITITDFSCTGLSPVSKDYRGVVKLLNRHTCTTQSTTCQQVVEKLGGISTTLAEVSERGFIHLLVIAVTDGRLTIEVTVGGSTTPLISETLYTQGTVTRLRILVHSGQTVHYTILSGTLSIQRLHIEEH